MFFSIDDRDPRPAYQQIAAALKEQVRAGTVRPGDELPSVRELARDLDINLHTVRHAYQLLSQEGVIYLRLGRRARVAPVRSISHPTEVDPRFIARLQELVTDAYHMGMSAEQFRALIEQQLQNTVRRSDKK